MPSYLHTCIHVCRHARIHTSHIGIQVRDWADAGRAESSLRAASVDTAGTAAGLMLPQTTILLYCTTLLHYYTTTRLHHYTTALLHPSVGQRAFHQAAPRRTTIPLYCATILLHSYTVTQLNRYTTTLRPGGSAADYRGLMRSLGGAIGAPPLADALPADSSTRPQGLLRRGREATGRPDQWSPPADSTTRPLGLLRHGRGATGKPD